MQNEGQWRLPSFLQPLHTHLLSGSLLPISVTRSNRLCRRFSVVQIAKLGKIAFFLELLVQHALGTILVDRNPLIVTTYIIISSKSSSFQFSSFFQRFAFVHVLMAVIALNQTHAVVKVDIMEANAKQVRNYTLAFAMYKPNIYARSLSFCSSYTLSYLPRPRFKVIVNLCLRVFSSFNGLQPSMF